MPRTPFADVLRFLHKACAIQGACDRTDCELLEQFLAQEETAFALLVERHGRMVLGVCRRLSADSHAAEDSFQATFMVLARRAASIRKKVSVASWLHGVAQRIALKARARAAARRKLERRVRDLARAEPIDELTWQELRKVLDEEISRLPEKCRAPILLCYFEGKSHSQAARELGWPKNSVTNRLARGRELLRRQLVRRGALLSAGMLTTALSAKALGAPVAALQTINVVKAATSFGAGKVLASGCISARSIALAEEALKGIVGINGKLGVMVLTFGLAIGGGGWAGYGALTERSQSAPPAQAQSPERKNDLPISSNHASQPVKPTPDQNKVNQEGTDSRGDLLPEGAILRFGSTHLRHGGTIYASALSPDGKVLATAGRHSVIVWNLDTRKSVHHFPCDHQSSFSCPGLTFSSDGTRLGYVRSSYFACVWDLQAGKEMRRFERKFQDGLTKFWASGCCFINEGKEFVLCSHEAIQTWNLDTGQEISCVPVANMVRDLSPDGKIYWRDDGKGGVILGDARTGKEVSRIADVRHPSFAEGLAFSPDGKTLAVVLSSANGDRDMEVRETSTGKVLTSFPLPASAQKKDPIDNRTRWEFRFTFAPDGKTVLLGTWGGLIHRWDVATGKELSALSKPHCAVAGMHPLPDGRTLISTGQDGVIHRWDLQSGRHDAEPEYYQGKSQAAFSADGRFAAIGDARGRIDLWDARSGRMVRTLQQDGAAPARLAFAPDCLLLAAAERSGTVRFWQVPSGKQGAVWQREPVNPKGEWFCNGLHFSPDGRLICISDYPKQIRVVEVGSGKLLWTGANSYGEAFFPDGATLLVATPAGPNVTMLDVKNGQRISTVRLNSKTPDDLGGWYQFAFSPDGRRLALAFDGGTLMLCDGRTCAEKQRLAEHDYLALHRQMMTEGKTPNQIHALAFAPDSKWFASAGSDGAVYIWEAATGQEVLRLPGHEAEVSSVSFSPDGRTIFSYGQDGQGYAWDLMPRPPAGQRPPVDEMWADLADTKAAKAYRAIWMLFAAPKESVPFLRDRLKPVPAADPGKLQKLLVDLDSDKFATRQSAAKELEKIGEQLQVPIQEALKRNITLETRRRLELILKNLPDIPGPETLRTMRAIAALERIGSPEAQRVLEALARGAPGARETEEASASLRRLPPRASRVP